ncbi:hypothetical protein MM236_13540 [Belliella sp. DSM 107340]|uniref:Peptide zinc metalloprotease protein n=1 Tax=Belliella calami TaxID=2923436 RepID=A0ABS9URY3_9BACT|nr:hypothetical protein [Belliella calami]MCH7399023.1 hypothetical protein [Belliella calami]
MIFLKEHIITPFDKNRWVVNTNDGIHLLINNETRKLLNIVVNCTDLGSATSQFNDEYSQNLSLNDFECLIVNKFSGSGILVNFESNLKKSYMSIKIPLLSSKLAGYVSQPFKHLFNPLIFWFSLMLYSTLLIFLSIKYFSFDFDSIRLLDLVSFSVLFYTSMLIHELGHIAACKYFKVKHGEIGFGFYLIFPVVYAQITNVWSLKKHHRIITNLGGVYLELFYASMISLFFLFTYNYVYLYVSLLIFIKTISELNPFIRYDGYWILSDLTDTPNLLLKSNEAVKAFFSKDKRSGLFMKEGFIWILIYGIMNVLIVGFYMCIILVNYWEDILDFPAKIITAFHELFLGSTESIITLISLRYLLIAGFYILLLKLGISLLARIPRKKSLEKNLA